jgi:heavy metal sensor kinase
MRSIRLSLMLYFLLLLGAALGGVSYFCYQSTQEALRAKEASTSKLAKKQFDENKDREDAKFDAEILSQARKLGDKIIWHQHRVEALYVLGVLGNNALTGNALNSVLPVAEAAYQRLAMKLVQMRPDMRIQHPEDENYSPVIEAGHYFQTYQLGSAEGQFLEASDTLGGVEWRLTKAARQKAEERPFFDTVKLPSGQAVRRVTLPVRVAWVRRGVIIPSAFRDTFRERGGPGQTPRTNDITPLSFGPKPTVYMQYGVDMTPHDKALAKLAEDLRSDLDQLRQELDDARADLRQRLLWINLSAFAALLLGGFWLVRRSLAPLNRLSDAVSKVSEKDFRLPVNQDKLPRELKPIAGRLAATLGQLKRAFAREKQAAADLSHELRTPVAALLTTLDITLRKQRSAEEYREVLHDCRESGRQIQQLVERLLALARLDAGADQLRPRDIDVNGLVDQCAALVRPLAEARGLRLSVHHNGPVTLHTDPDKLREVLTNLLHNAVEYNKPEGSIDVKVERDNGHLDLEVRDTGIGISSEARQHIFERFFRADPSRQADSPHAGLGLAIVKGYVDLMGGAIDVDSTPGAGSAFRVRLPAVVSGQ